jgi:hypothetical protein
MEDLIPTNMKMVSYAGEKSNAYGILIANDEVGRKKVKSAFYFIDDKPSYSIFLGRDWIHTKELPSYSIFLCHRWQAFIL